jgi:hypothetical protein
MKMMLVLAAAVLGLGMSLVSTPTLADPPPVSCGTPGATNCVPVGGAVCTANGCYQMQCNAFGCDLVFTPRNPFTPGTRER